MTCKSTVAVVSGFVLGLGAAMATTQSQQRPAKAGDFGEVQEFNLAAAEETTKTEEKTEVKTETTEVKETTESKRSEKNWDIWGPITLRSADPEPLGELEMKNIAHYGTSSNGEDDNVNYELELEYGFAPNHELILAVPLELGDGKAEGNGDLELGWHWRLWREQDWAPAFAIRNILYIPSGYHSRGLDWTLKGLLTKSIIEDKWRLHLNPYLTVASGDPTEEAPSTPSALPFRLYEEEGDLRDFQWGFIAGTDYRITDNLNLILDYIHRTSGVRGWRNQHEMEACLEWKITEHLGLGWNNNWTVDGDGLGENYGTSLSLVYNFDVPAIGK